MRATRFLAVATVGVACAISISACGGDGENTQKAGANSAPVTLRVGAVENAAAPYAEAVRQFAAAVEDKSNGTMTVEIEWDAAGPFTLDSEQDLAEMVRDGGIDLAVVATRVWDRLDVTSLQALQAPFLVDSQNLLNEVVESDVADHLMQGLDDIGVTGLALWPESLRHPIGYKQPMLTAADLDGAQFRIPNSNASFDLAEALGIESANEEEADPAGAIESGELDGAESAFVWSNDLPAFGTFTANITFFPKVNAIVANAELFDGLSDEQRQVLTDAATDTTAYVIDSNLSEAELAAAYCAAGGAVALAEDGDLAEITEKASPVIDELEGQPDTKRIMDSITEMKDSASTSGAAPSCQPEADERPVEESGDTAFPEGVYRAETPVDGVVTMSYHDGVWQRFFANGQLDCESTYVVKAGRIHITSSPDVRLACGNPPSQEVFDAAWTLEGDQLRFVDINSDPAAVAEFSMPWTKVQ